MPEGWNGDLMPRSAADSFMIERFRGGESDDEHRSAVQYIGVDKLAGGVAEKALGSPVALAVLAPPARKKVDALGRFEEIIQAEAGELRELLTCAPAEGFIFPASGLLADHQHSHLGFTFMRFNSPDATAVGS